MVVLSGFAGVFAGVAGAVLKSMLCKVDSLAKSFLSAYFNKSLANNHIDAAFLPYSHRRLGWVDGRRLAGVLRIYINTGAVPRAFIFCQPNPNGR